MLCKNQKEKFMKKILLASALLSAPALQAADTGFIFAPFEIETDQQYPLSIIEKKDFPTWRATHRLIEDNNYTDFAAQPIASLVNKVSHIVPKNTDAIHILTLLQYATTLPGTPERGKIIDLLLYNGAHVHCGYKITQEGRSKDNLPCIYYAVTKGNIIAFESLLAKDSTAPMQSAFNAWRFSCKEGELPTVETFVRKLLEIHAKTHLSPRSRFPDQLPTAETLNYMLTLCERNKSSWSSCKIS